MNKQRKGNLRIHKVKRPKKLAPFVGMCPYSPAPPMAVVRAKPMTDPTGWESFGRRNWIIRQNDTQRAGQHHWVYSRTNVPVCVPLAVPLSLLPYCSHVEAGWELEGEFVGEPARCEPYNDPTLSVTERISRWGTGQRQAFPEHNLTLSAAQTFSDEGTAPSDFAPNK